MSVIILYYLIESDLVNHAFPVDINRTNMISKLKKLIKREKASEFENLAENKLTIWKVNIPDDLDDLHTIEKTILLLPTRSVDQYFKQPPMEHIHVLVELSKGIDYYDAF